MRFIGIDYGKKNIGVALSDKNGEMAFPETTLKNDPSFFSNFGQICRQKEVEAVILGESLDFQGRPNKIMKDITVFKERIEKELNLPVHLEPEFMTTQEAAHIQGEHAQSDASAAAIILQSFLDKNKDKFIE